MATNEPGQVAGLTKEDRAIFNRLSIQQRMSYLEGFMGDDGRMIVAESQAQGLIKPAIRATWQIIAGL